MKKQQIHIQFEVYESIKELPSQEANLMNAAIKVRDQAYAPYSEFQVGAAVLLENDQIVLGNNQENASYPSGLCAEGVAVFYAGANYPNTTIKAIAISANSLNVEVDKPAAPCGNCRQAISEYEVKQNKPIAILMMGASGSVIKSASIADLLPLAFNSSYLE